ncbi:protein of unknown function [Kyrpidia spormannii]|uniref:Uncharacterized protein n=1 Tax=Kyrpidia spormannii TaxID=2055160 RepID=A0ACA8ZDW2_9BACL|nr:protein of unknown function [Kyrpidia spormannii]
MGSPRHRGFPKLIRQSLKPCITIIRVDVKFGGDNTARLLSPNFILTSNLQEIPRQRGAPVLRKHGSYSG